MKLSILRPLLFFPLLTLLSACVINSPKVAERTADGLVRVPAKQVDTLYAVPGASLAPYHRLLLDSVEIAFKSDWQKRHPEVTPEQVARIRAQGAQVFRDIFTSALTMNGGLGITTQPGPDVLRVSATVSELDVGASPVDAAGKQSFFVMSPADLTLLMELRDSQSGALLVRAIDKETGRTSGNLQVVDAVSNSAEARRALEMWAGLLRGALDAARATPAPAAAH
jgi:hypothetical protein